MVLAELGADVVRIDRPTPHPLSPRSTAADLLGRGKRSAVLDLKTQEGRGKLAAICGRADVVLEGFRPGVIERLGIAPEVIWRRNRRLVYGRMTGWGQAGPAATTAGHDISYIAPTGVLHAIGDHGAKPQVPLNLIGDLGGGATYLVIGVLAALWEARATGRGQVVDAAIVDGASHLLAIVHSLLADDRWRDERGVNLLDGGVPYYAVYATSDDRYMAVGAIEPQFYAAFIDGLGVDVDLDAQNDPAQWPALGKLFSDAFSIRTQEEWTQVFRGTDSCVSPVLGLREAVTDPHLAARQSLVNVNGVVQAMPAPRFSAHPLTLRKPPLVGQHTEEVLAWSESSA
jgi:alpha-methylacyl-CoA racemase